MSTADSPAASDIVEKKARSEVLFRFCPECSNMLYPKEDRATSELLYVCRACHAVQKFDTNCTERKYLSSTITETSGVTTDVANDPTLPRTTQKCPKCGENDAVYFQSQQRAADTGMRLFYVCTSCNADYTIDYDRDK